MDNEISVIVAVGKNGEIGRQGQLLFQLPGDLKRFKELTTGHPVIMGRKTWESLPKRPLPGRRNIVITSRNGYTAEGAEIVSSPLEALEITNGESPFIIGGGEIYNTLLPYSTHLYLTEVDAEVADADTFINLDKSDWILTSSSPEKITPSGITFRFLDFRRK